MADKWVIRRESHGWVARPPMASFFYGRKIGAYEFDTLLGVVVNLVDQEKAGLMPTLPNSRLKVGR